MNSYVGGNVCARFDLERDACCEVGEEDREFGPFEVPAVFDGEKRVAAREDRRHGEGAVGIGLIAVE